MAHFHLHHLDKALAAIDESIELAPDFDAAHSLRAVIEAELAARS